MLLNTFPKSISLVFGICLLLIVVMMSFTHIFGGIDCRARSRIKAKRKFLFPLQDLSRNCTDFFANKKDFNKWSSEDKDFFKKYEEITSEFKILRDKESKLNYTIDVINVLFIIAISLIIYSILRETIVPTISNFILKL
jgi:hypothetical protein